MKEASLLSVKTVSLLALGICQAFSAHGEGWRRVFNTVFFDDYPSASISFGDLVETVKNLCLTLEINNHAPESAHIFSFIENTVCSLLIHRFSKWG